MKRKRTLTLVAAALFLVSGATAVVGYDGPKNQPHIMSGGSSSASGSAAAGPNGTVWSHSVKMRDRSSNITEDRLENVDFLDKEYRVEFTGYITAPTPCHILDSELTKTESRFILNVNTVREQTDGGNRTACVQQLTMIEYDAEFHTHDDFTLEIRHDNETIRTLKHPGIEDEVQEPRKPKRGIFQKISNWLSGLFGNSEPIKTAEPDR